MKQKACLFLLALIVGSIFVYQFTNVLTAHAEGNLISSPISTPISGPKLTPTPTTKPISSPITAPILTPTPIPTPKPIPVTSHYIMGQVNYVVFNFAGFGWKSTPAQDVLIEARNVQTGQLFTVKTDRTGRYSLKLKDGFYKITVSDKYGSQFFNPISYVLVNRDINWLNFMGIKAQPIKQYQVKGQVNYFGYQILKGRFIYKRLPAVNVTVEARNIKTGQLINVKTDSAGNFSFKLDENQYTIRIIDNKGTFFWPYSQSITVNKDISGLKFDGFVGWLK